MGTKREYDSGRFDILGRRIKESGKNRNSRAQDMRTTKEALEDLQRIATEFNSEVENAVEFGMNENSQGLNESAMRAAYFYGLYKKWSEEVENISQADAQHQYAQFRKEYGLGKGASIRINPNKMYETVDQESVHQAQEAIYDVLSSNYADRFTEEELNRYKEKVGSYKDNEPVDEEEVRREYEAKYQQEQAESRPEDYGEARNERQKDGYSNRGQEGHEDRFNRKATSENIYSRFSKSQSAGYRAQQGFGGGGNGGYSGGGQPPRGSGRPMPGGGGGGLFNTVEDFTGLGNHGSFRVTWRPRIGPFVMNMGRKGPMSVSADMGPLRYMVWQRNRGFGAWFSSFDLPSFLSFRGNRK